MDDLTIEKHQLVADNLVKESEMSSKHKEELAGVTGDLEATKALHKGENAQAQQATDGRGSNQ